MKPTYQVKAWKDDGWWLAQVTAASDEADPAPLNAITQARSLAKLDEMARDLVATILDEEEDTFDVEVEYDLPVGVGALLTEAVGARAWLDAAQVLWQERATAAARALTTAGFSLREAAQLLGLSHQRVDQLLESDKSDDSKHMAVVVQAKHMTPAAYTQGSFWRQTRVNLAKDADFVVFVTSVDHDHGRGSAEDRQSAREYLREALIQFSEQEVVGSSDDGQNIHDERCGLQSSG